MTLNEHRRMEELYRKGRYIEYCGYYEKPLKVLTKEEIDHCRSCGDLCHFLGKSCDWVEVIVEGFEGDDWDEDWDYLWDELNT